MRDVGRQRTEGQKAGTRTGIKREKRTLRVAVLKGAREGEKNEARGNNGEREKSVGFELPEGKL